MVITGLTRNQLGRKVSWVRIPPAPPDMNRTVKLLLRLGSAVLFCVLRVSCVFFLPQRHKICMIPYSVNTKLLLDMDIGYVAADLADMFLCCP